MLYVSVDEFGGYQRDAKVGAGDGLVSDFPERFCNGNKENDPDWVKPWGYHTVSNLDFTAAIWMEFVKSFLIYRNLVLPDCT